MHLSEPFFLNCYTNISCEIFRASKGLPKPVSELRRLFQRIKLTPKCAGGVVGQREKLVEKLQSKSRSHLASLPSPRRDCKIHLGSMLCSALRRLSVIITGDGTRAGTRS